MAYTPRPLQDALLWQKDLRSRLNRLLKIEDLLASKNTFSFQPAEIHVGRKDKYLVRELEINSTSRRRIRILLTVPLDLEGPLPAVLCLGGHGSTLYSPYALATTPPSRKPNQTDRLYKAFGTELARRGYVTISTTVSQHNIYEKGRLLMGERLWDCLRCIDYLESLPTVDRKRIGCAGLSLGGEMAMWVGAMDERVAAVVSAGFLTVMDQMEHNHCLCWKFNGLRALADFSDIYALTAPRPLQCQNGLKEPPSQFHVPLARRALAEIQPIYRDLDRPENITLDVHPGGHEIDLPALIRFFEKHLHQNRWPTP